VRGRKGERESLREGFAFRVLGMKLSGEKSRRARVGVKIKSILNGFNWKYFSDLVT
jgi:hypothetical protein